MTATDLCLPWLLALQLASTALEQLARSPGSFDYRAGADAGVLVLLLCDCSCMDAAAICVCSSARASADLLVQLEA